MNKENVIIYVYIYIHMCVCSCVCAFVVYAYHGMLFFNNMQILFFNVNMNGPGEY